MYLNALSALNSPPFFQVSLKGISFLNSLGASLLQPNKTIIRKIEEWVLKRYYWRQSMIRRANKIDKIGNTTLIK